MKNPLQLSIPIRIFYVFISVFISNYAFSQKEANNWYFGVNAGITFNTDPVSALTNGQLNSQLNTATMSSKSGKLLFYSDGISVWDSTHTITPNGTGLNSPTPGKYPTVIIPRPGNSRQYYLITSDGNSGGTNGLQYSVFDMSLNSGKGDIISSKKKIFISSMSGMKITAVQHKNGNDYWLLTHLNEMLNGWLVTSSGISTSPVQSIIGFLHDQNGCMKVSPDGTKILATTGALSIDTCSIADFDVNSGKASNVWRFSLKGSFGIEFSPASNYVYLTATNGYRRICQFNPKVKSNADFVKSMVIVDTIANGSAGGGYGAMQVGPDKRIYTCRAMDMYLDVINDPNLQGKSCNVQQRAVYLGGKTAYLGLPTFIQSYFDPEFSVKATCYGDTSRFTIGDSTNVDSVQWNFGDPDSKNKNTARGFKVYHLFSKTGNYVVRSIAFQKTLRDTNYFEVEQKIYLGRLKELGKLISKCYNDTLTLKVKKGSELSIKWSTGSNSDYLKVYDTGSVWVKKYYGSQCYSDDTARVSNKNSISIRKFTLGPDTFICKNQSIWIGYFEEGFGEYLWNDQYTSPFLIPDTAGLFWLKIKDDYGCYKTDTIKVSLLPPPKVNLGKDTAFCNNPYYVLDAKNVSPFNKFKWGTNRTRQTDTALKTGKYWVRVTNSCGTSIDTINLKFLKKPKINLPSDTIICDTVSIKLDGANANNEVKYSWSTKALTQTILVKDTGIYSLIVSNSCGKDSASVHVFKCLKSLTFNVANTCINIPSSFSIPETFRIDSVKWDFGDTASKFNSSTQIKGASHIYSNPGQFKVRLVAYYKGQSDTFTSLISIKKLKADFTVSDVCENDSARFINKYKDSAGAIYQWQFGDGKNSTLMSPSHLYTIGGISQTFNVSLSIKTAEGCSDSVTSHVTVNASPLSGFSFSTNKNIVDFSATQTGNTEYKWIFGNGDSVTTGSSSYKYTYPNISKTYLACLTSINAVPCSSKTCKEITITLGTLTINNSPGFKVYPNPNSGNFTLEIDNLSNDVSIEVYNLLGEKVGIVRVVEKVTNVNLDMANGIYLIKVKNGGMIYYQKVSISK